MSKWQLAGNARACIRALRPESSAYYPPSRPDPKTQRGARYIMDHGNTYESHHGHPPPPKDDLPSGYTASGAAVWD